MGRLPGFSRPLRRLKSGFTVQEIYWRDNRAHDEAWADAESVYYGGRRSPRWQQNYEMALVHGGTPVYPMLAPDVHVQAFPLEDLRSGRWGVWCGLDHGIRHATCCLWAAVNKEGDLHVFREYYGRDLPIKGYAAAIRQAGAPGETVRGTVADPACWQRTPETLKTIADLYQEAGLTITAADNVMLAGVERVTAMLVATLARWSIFHKDPGRIREALRTPTLVEGVIHDLARHPALTFSPACPRAFAEMVNWRYVAPTGDPRTRAPAERFVDVDDEGPDVVRYLAQSPKVRWSAPRPAREGEDLVLSILEKRARARG